MKPLESVYLKSRAVTKPAARGHSNLVEQALGLRALAAAHLVADGDGRVPLRPAVAEPRLVLPRGTPHSAVSWVEGGSATVTRDRARDGPESIRMLKRCWNRTTPGRFPGCSTRLEPSLPHERPAVREDMYQTWIIGSCQS